MEERKGQRRLKRYSLMLQSAVSLAAAVLIACGVIYYTHVGRQKRVMAQIAQIKPEGQHAVLYLADGASVDLGLRDSIAVRTETGVEVEMTGENSLAYKPRKTQPQKQEEVPEEYNTLVTPRGSEYSLTLADGTQLWLNAASRLRFFTSDRGRERRVWLEGEAYFEVTHNPRRPFVVEFEGGEIQVLGTSFNVKAYRDDVIVAVTLDEGRVVLDDRRGGRFELSPSEQLLYDRRSGEGRIVRGADAMRYSIWKDDVISFRDTPLAEVLETLSRWYDVRFDLTQQPPQPISYTFTTDNTLLDNVLREMELISPVCFERSKTEIKVSFR